MGAGISSQRITKEDRIKRQNLQYELGKMQNSLRVTSASHYISSEHYWNRNIGLQYTFLFTAAIASGGGVASKLAWNMMVSSIPRLAPILVSTCMTPFLLTAIVNLPLNQNAPGKLYEAHFRSGLECQYLEKKVKFFSETEVWDSKVAWETLAAKYEKLLSDKKEVNSKIKSENWAYRKALKKIDDREREKKAKSLSEEQVNPGSSVE